MINPVGWRTSSFSNGGGGECVEVRDLPAEIQVRDTKDRSRPAVQYSDAAWRAFLSGVKSGEFE